MKTAATFIILLLLAGTGAKAQHLPANGTLYNYIENLEGQQQFLQTPLPAQNQQQYLQTLLQTTLLGNAAEYSLQNQATRQSPDGTYYTFDVVYNHQPVFGQQVKAMVDKQSVLRYIYHTAIPLPAAVANNPITPDFIAGFAAGFTGKTITGNGLLWVPNGEELLPAFYLTIKDPEKYTYEQRLFTASGQLLYINPLYQRSHAVDTPSYAYVYNPDPLSTAHVPYGGLFANNGGKNTPVLREQLQRKLMNVTLQGDSLILSNNRFYISELTLPLWPQTRVKWGHDFLFSRSLHSFGEVNAFYHLNTFTDYVHSLGYTGLPGYRIQVDAHAFNGQDRSQFTPGDVPPSLQFGDGGIPDAEDADVMVHEFGHALAYGAAPNSSIGYQRMAIDEGIGDYFAVSYSRSLSNFQYNKVFTWDGNNGGWQGRTVDYQERYPNFSNKVWTDGQLWSTSFARIFDFTNRATADMLLLETLYRLAPNITMPQLAAAVLQIDTIKNGGANTNAIQCAFYSTGIIATRPAGCIYTTVHEISPEKNHLFTAYNTAGFANNGEDILVEFAQEGSYILRLTDMQGRVINIFSTTAAQTPVSAQGLSAGVYFLHVQNAKGYTESLKLLRY